MSDDHQAQDDQDDKIAKRRRMLKLMGLSLAASFVAPMAFGLNEASAQGYGDWRNRRRRSRSRSRRSRSRDDRRWRGRYSRRRNWRGRRRRHDRSRSRRSRSRD